MNHRDNIFSNEGSVIRNQRGMSLVEVMVAIGIMGIVMAGMATMQINQMRETRAVGEKLASLELQRTLTQVMSSGAVCNFIFNTDTTNRSGLNKTPPNSTFTVPMSGAYPLKNAFTMNNIPMTDSTASTLAAAVNSAASSYSNSLKVSSISLDITGSGTGGQFSADLNVTFNSPGGPDTPVRQIKMLSMPLVLQTTIAGPTATVTGCTANVLASAGSCPAGQFLSGFNSAGSKVCQAPPAAPPVPTYPVLSAANANISGSAATVFPGYNAIGNCNKMPATCSGSFNTNAAGSSWSSNCTTGWVWKANCDDASGNPIPNCPMLVHPTTGTPCT